ncbi:uncharacterized protein LOC119769289 [Culex quinquefasciatus]|uniref:uncharacterized protein LOC119769289 n=1 Tax=Culex quinquefasciatus TaxID=7176 RepID=UPI0018E3A193|nr:uncharacterized protein LOC119769289 [Culex quinquefasciatus]
MAPKPKPDVPADCVVCGKAKGDDAETVECEACRLWAHLACAGETGKVENYFCPNCSQSLQVPKTRKNAKKPKSDAGTTSGAADLPKDVLEQLELERVEREKKMAQEVMIRMKRIEMEKSFAEQELRMERELQEREFAAANEVRALKLKMEQEFLDRQKAAEEEFLAKQKEMKKLIKKSKQKLEKTAVDPPAGKSEGAGAGSTDTPKGVLGKPKIPVPKLSDSDPDSSGDESDEKEDPTTPVSGSREVSDGPGKPVTKLTKEQLAARQAMSRHLPKFSGEPEVWPLFISSFRYTTEACGFTNVDNLKRLVDCLEGPALTLVQGRLVLPDAVPDVIEDLRHMFGRPEKLLRALLQKVRNARAPTSENLDTFIHFGITIKQLCDHLEVSGMKDHLNNPMLVQELVERLPTSHQLDWVRYRRGKVNTPLRMLSDFLSELVEDVSEVAEFAALSLQEPTKSHGGKGKRNEFVHLHEATREKAAGGRTSMACYVCKQTSHLIRNCSEFRGMRVPERMKTVERLKLCTVCLSSHGNSACHSKMRCQIGNCRGHHHPLLHREEAARQFQRVDCNTHKVDGGVIFRTIPITMYAGSKAFNTLAFLDEGSSSTLMEEYVANKLGVQGKLEPLVVSWTAEIDRHENQSRRVSLTLAARGSREMFQLENVRTVSKLQLPQQDVRFAEVQKRYDHLAGVQVAEQVKEKPTILIGLDNIHLFAPLESRVGQQGEPIAVRSKLGWTVYGPDTPKPLVHTFLNLHVVKPASNQELHDMMRDQYVLDEAGVASFAVPESAEDQRAKKILETTTKRTGERFETGLLWREDERRFPDSYPMATRRLQALERKLDKNPALKQNVSQQIAEYQNKGYAHKATAEELKTPSNAVWYLPLNVVLNPRKPDKTRLIWDAAASVRGVSLNSQLLKGPDMLVPLPRVVCRFRERPIALGGDIQEMYHQIRIREEDKQAQRFLFRENPADAPQVYVMDVATFGSACSPSSAQFVKNLNADQYAEEFPEAAAAIKERHYVDDYYDSVDTVEEAIRRANEVKFIHSKGGFNIRNWVSNSKKVLDEMGERSVKTSVHFNQEKSAFYERVLGIVWEPDQDVFCFAVASKPEFRDVLTGERRPTKRIVLSVVMAQFDPAGFLGPITILGKILVQDLWRTGCEWDEMIDELAFQRWLRWINILADAKHFKLPRCYFGNARWDEIEEIQLHIFADAGDKAYGCVAYFRAVVRGEVVVALVMSRSKVAPLKMLSIPRLELESCVLAARMSQAIHDNHSFPISKTFFWTDSAVVLSWIRSDQRRYKQFVGFRIGAILSMTSLMDWNFVPTQHNIADILTKWGKDPNVRPDSPWVCCPRFIHDQQVNWPKKSLPPPNTTEELRVHLLLHDVQVVDTIVEVNHFSRWTMLVRTMACAHRFVSNLKRKTKGLPMETLRATKAQAKMLRPTTVPSVRVALQQDEYKQAEVYLLKMVQAESFIDESSPLYKLTPLVDEDGLLRMEGRTENAEFLPFDLRFPVILPKDHHVTRMIVQHYHQKFGHGYRETIKNELRQRFFILGVNTLVRQVAAACVWCKVHRNQPLVPRMAALPVQRITPNLRPFSYVGVDYLGPLDVSVGRRSEKRWVALFTCFVTRAVHLEVAYGLTAQTCLMAIRRFICRRGPPVEFFSDNGTNFRGASKELVETVRSIGNDCAEVLTTSRTKWTFNPPAAPHMGGVWERLVRSVKEALEALDDGRRLTDEILVTCLAEAEDMINSRPLTYVAQESSQAEALTPNHFIRGVSPNEPNAVPPSPHPAEALRDAYKRSQQLADVMWQRWVKEYVPSVNQRTKWFGESRPLKAGDLVYIVDGKNRKSWIRGVVEEPIVSGDGRIRQAWVRTSSGLVKRATARLAVLEIEGKPASEASEPGLRAGGC